MPEKGKQPTVPEARAEPELSTADLSPIKLAPEGLRFGDSPSRMCDCGVCREERDEDLGSGASPLFRETKETTNS